jgi:hypothetical protein
MKTQLLFNISSVCGRHHSAILKREDTTSGEDTTSDFSNSVFGRQYSTDRNREDTTSRSSDNSVDCSGTNVIVMPQITGENSLVEEAVCFVVFIIILIESD